MYVLTRTAGPPLGPHEHVPEAAGTIELATTATEVVLVGVLVAMLGATARRRVCDLLLLAGVLLCALRLARYLPYAHALETIR